MSRAHSLKPTIETRARGLEENSADWLSQQSRDLPHILVTTRRCRVGRGAARVCLGGARPCECWLTGLPEGFFWVRFPGPNLRQVQCPATVAGHTLCPLFWAGSRPPFGDRLSARGGQRADAGAAMLSAPGVGRCAGDLTHRGGCLARALGLQSSCVGVAVAVFGRSAVLWAR